MADHPLELALLSCISDLLKAPRIWVAYSGGVDSHVLLHACASLKRQYPTLNIRAVHIHHGLWPTADEWARHAESVCQNLDISFQKICVTVPKIAGESSEEQARCARYQALESCIQKDEILLTAHQMDDQAETCLLQFLRGAGPKGLAAMPELAPFSKGYHYRPFLRISRKEILEYALHHQLQWVEDHSNQDVRYTRNYLRSEILPLLKKRWPGVSKTISRVSRHCAEADALLMECAAEDLRNIIDQKTRALSIEKLKQLSFLRQKQVVRYWLHQQNFLLPTTVQCDHLFNEMINGVRPDAEPCLRLKDVEIHRYQNHLYAMAPLAEIKLSHDLKWNFSQPLVLPNELGTLTASLTHGEGLKQSVSSVTVRFRQGGEPFRLFEKQGTRPLKKWFQEWHIPPWQRDRIPLIYVNDELAMVVGYGLAESFKVQSPNEAGWKIELLG